MPTGTKSDPVTEGFENITFIAHRRPAISALFYHLESSGTESTGWIVVKIASVGKSAINQPRGTAAKLTDNYRAKKTRFLVIQSLQM